MIDEGVDDLGQGEIAAAVRGPDQGTELAFESALAVQVAPTRDEEAPGLRHGSLGRSDELESSMRAMAAGEVQDQEVGGCRLEIIDAWKDLPEADVEGEAGVGRLPASEVVAGNPVRGHDARGCCSFAPVVGADDLGNEISLERICEHLIFHKTSLWRSFPITFSCLGQACLVSLSAKANSSTASSRCSRRSTSASSKMVFAT